MISFQYKKHFDGLKLIRDKVVICHFDNRLSTRQTLCLIGERLSVARAKGCEAALAVASAGFRGGLPTRPLAR